MCIKVYFESIQLAILKGHIPEYHFSTSSTLYILFTPPMKNHYNYLLKKKRYIHFHLWLSDNHKNLLHL